MRATCVGLFYSWYIALAVVERQNLPALRALADEGFPRTLIGRAVEVHDLLAPSAVVAKVDDAMVSPGLGRTKRYGKRATRARSKLRFAVVAFGEGLNILVAEDDFAEYYRRAPRV